MHQHQHVDIGRDRVEIERAIVSTSYELAQLLDDRHRLHRAAAHRRHHVAFERQARSISPTTVLLREGEAVDQLGQIVFEKALALGLRRTAMIC